VLFVLFLIIPFVSHTIGFLLPDKYTSWQITEWLINYSGGFVRRGLPGTLLYWVSLHAHIPPNQLIVLISMVSYLILALVFCRLLKNLLPVWILFSPFLLGMPVWSNFTVRKDTFILLLFAGCIAVVRKVRGFIPMAVILNAVAVIGVLCHEIFMFISLPFLWVLISTRMAKTKPAAHRHLIPAAVLSPLISAGVWALLHHGDASIADKITSSWNILFGCISGITFRYAGPEAAIDGIRWTTDFAMSLALDDLSKSILPVTAGIGLIWFVICTTLHRNAVSSKDDKRVASRERIQGLFTVIALVQLVSVLPLFFAGKDFGRWIFLWISSSLLILPCCINEPVDLLERLSLSTAKIIPRFMNSLTLNPLLFLFVGFPCANWCLSEYFQSMPVGCNMHLINEIFLMFL
jgi:hypothetical protein